jgi:hypothetical protein
MAGIWLLWLEFSEIIQILKSLQSNKKTHFDTLILKNRVENERFLRIHLENDNFGIFYEFS